MAPSFPVHLCQPDEGKSCAACCGIYNFIFNDKGRVSRRLRRNTRFLGSLPARGSASRIEAHGARWRAVDNGPGKRFEALFNCEYAGFLNPEGTRVGCLLHPRRHGGGYDLRDHSFYGAELCEGHFCLSYYYLTPDEQKLVVNTLDDWYLYGLVITDMDLVKGFSESVANRLGRVMDPVKAGQGALKSKVRSFFALKLHWPFRSKSPHRFGKYRFRGEEYETVSIPYRRLHRPVSPYDAILKALGSEFGSPEDLDSANAFLDRLVGDAARAYEAQESK